MAVASIPAPRPSPPHKRLRCNQTVSPSPARIPPVPYQPLLTLIQSPGLQQHTALHCTAPKSRILPPLLVPRLPRVRRREGPTSPPPHVRALSSYPPTTRQAPPRRERREPLTTTPPCSPSLSQHPTPSRPSAASGCCCNAAFHSSSLRFQPSCTRFHQTPTRTTSPTALPLRTCARVNPPCPPSGQSTRR